MRILYCYLLAYSTTKTKEFIIITDENIVLLPFGVLDQLN